MGLEGENVHPFAVDRIRKKNDWARWTIGSLLPQDVSLFQWDRNSGEARYHTCRIVCGWADRRHRRAIDMSADRSRQLPDAMHLLSVRTVAIDAVGIQLDLHGIRIEIIEIDLNLKDVLLAVSLNLHAAEA